MYGANKRVDYIYICKREGGNNQGIIPNKRKKLIAECPQIKNTQ